MGYLKHWMALAEKRHFIQDYEGAYLLNAYASFIGLPRASYGAGYLWEKGKLPENYRCKLSSNYKCALYYYFNGIDYYKSKIKIADILYWRDNSNKSDNTVDKVAYQLYEMVSNEDAYSLYSMASMI
jgi:hypothetical protein